MCFEMSNRKTPTMTSFFVSSALKPNAVSLPPSLSTQARVLAKGCNVLVEALERQGVRHVFAYPGAASIDIHNALAKSDLIKNILPRHEQGGIFAAEGYARASGFPGVCIASSGPGATNLITGLADAMMDSIPIVAITGQVPKTKIGTDAFQETPIVEVTRSITKHSYFVSNVADIPYVVNEAFYIARSGRPGPVLIDLPADVQQQLVVPNWNTSLKISGHLSRLSKTKTPNFRDLEPIIKLISAAKKPVLYVGGGCLDSSVELRRFVDLTGIPVASTLMGLGSFPCTDDLSLHLLGMHGTVYANYAVENSDLLLAFGVRFDERVTGKIEAFASRAKIVHIEIDQSQIGKIKKPHLSICSDLNLVLPMLNRLILSKKIKLNLACWKAAIDRQKKRYPLRFKCRPDSSIPPQYAIKVLDELTNGEAIVTSGVGQHQMWAAQFYNFTGPRQWLTSSGLGAMGFGLPAAIGAKLAKPNAVVVDIDGDGSFIMNVQELATIRAENLGVKIMILNNQHLGMVVQGEDVFCKGKGGCSYLGKSSEKGRVFPDMVKFAEACDIPSARVSKRSEVRGAVKKMLDTPGPYLLDVIVPLENQVFPIIPNGGCFKDTIYKEDENCSYY